MLRSGLKAPVSLLFKTPVLYQVCHYSQVKLDSEAEKLRIQVDAKRMLDLKKRKWMEQEMLREQKKRDKLKEKMMKEKRRMETKKLEEKIRKLKETEREKLRLRKVKDQFKKLEQKKKEMLKAVDHKKREKRHRDPEAPKRAITAFFWYNMEHFNETKQKMSTPEKTASLVEVTKALREKFNALPPEEKKKYLQLEEQDKQRYARERQAYLKKKKSHYAGKPQTPYMRFQKDVLEEVKKEHPGLPVTERAKIIGEMWRKLSEDKKKEYHDAYKRELEASKESK